MKRSHTVGTLAVTGGTATVTVADDLPEPYAALSLICVTALAVSAAVRLVHRLEGAQRALRAERRRRATVEREYAALVEDFNDLALEHAERSADMLDRPEHEHGPRCTCGGRARPYLSLVEREPRQGSA